MNPMMRWLRFNAVGAMGMAVQLGALSLLNRAAPGHYLLWSATAVELAILHNFAWHRRFTWRDRADVRFGWGLARFHAANGLVSLAGNVALMRVFVGLWRWPLVVGNFAAIAVCSLVNFWLGDGWVFRAEARPGSISKVDRSAKGPEPVHSVTLQTYSRQQPPGLPAPELAGDEPRLNSCTVLSRFDSTY